MTGTIGHGSVESPAAAASTQPPTGEASRDVDDGRSWPIPPGLPDGLFDLAGTVRRRAAHLAGEAPRSSAAVDAELVALLTAPLRLDDPWPAPAAPVAVGGGWVHVEVIDDDRPLLDSVLAGRPPSGPEEAAVRCQELRLPVSPYRRRTAVIGPPDPGIGSSPAQVCRHEATPAETGPLESRLPDDNALEGAVIIDLTTHWAGPLATKLLAEAGARVIKIDPRCRPDGFRARPNLYRHLNGNKEIIDLDLRLPDQRHRFEGLLAGADLLVESFSRRVMANLGYRPADLWALGPRLSMLSVKAYPDGSPEADWLAFGPGVHAASGLGLTGDQPMPAPVAYPDLLAGLNGYLQAIRLLNDAAIDRTAHRAIEVSLAGSIEPLVGRARTVLQ